VNETLLRFGGMNIYGEPFFRCVWSGNRTEIVLGEWHDYDQKAVDVDDEGRRTVNAPTRVVYEARRVVKYPTWPERFIVEEWQPPHAYGPPETWPETLGPYPSRGDYELAKVCDTCPYDCVQRDACKTAGHQREFFAPDAAWARLWVVGYQHFRDTFDPARVRRQRHDARAAKAAKRKADIRDQIASFRPAFGLVPWAQVRGGRDDVPAA
jgi:hypothetical protein